MLKFSKQVTTAQLAAGAALPYHVRKVIQRDRKIDELKGRFSSNCISYSRRTLVRVSAHISVII